MTDTSGCDNAEWATDTRGEFDTNDSLANENQKCIVMLSSLNIFSYLDYTLAIFLSSQALIMIYDRGRKRKCIKIFPSTGKEY